MFNKNFQASLLYKVQEYNIKTFPNGLDLIGYCVDKMLYTYSYHAFESNTNQSIN